MSLLTKIKSVLGLGDGNAERGRDLGDQTVRFGSSPDEEPGPTETAAPTTDTERAVKEPVSTAETEAAGGDAKSPSEPLPDDESPAPASGEAAAGSAPSGTDEAVTVIKGIGPTYGDRLAEAGIDSVGDLAAADADDIEEQTGISANRAAGWIEQARSR